jgi:hypothetical protein
MGYCSAVWDGRNRVLKMFQVSIQFVVHCIVYWKKFDFKTLLSIKKFATSFSFESLMIK